MERAVRARGARASRAWAGALALALAACGSARPYRPAPPGDLRQNAAGASERGDWELAADLWHRVQLAAGPQEERPIVETARALLQTGDVQGAGAMVELGLAHHPQSADLRELRGDVLARQRFRRAAEGAYREALALEPERTSALLRLARLQVELGLDRSAIATLERLLAIGAADYEVYRLLALARTAAGEPVAAWDAWSHAFTLGDGDVLDQVRAASLALQPEVVRERKSAAESCRHWLELALERDPQCTQAHFQIGVLAESAGDLETAEACYLRAAETDPAYLPALTNLALLYARKGEGSRVREMVQRALLLERDPERCEALKQLVMPFVEPAHVAPQAPASEEGAPSAADAPPPAESGTR